MSVFTGFIMCEKRLDLNLVPECVCMLNFYIRN